MRRRVKDDLNGHLLSWCDHLADRRDGTVAGHSIGTHAPVAADERRRRAHARRGELPHGDGNAPPVLDGELLGDVACGHGDGAEAVCALERYELALACLAEVRLRVARYLRPRDPHEHAKERNDDDTGNENVFHRC